MENSSFADVDKELLEDFLNDSFEITKSAKELLTQFSQSKDPHEFEKFGQSIDRIMGAAFTLGFNHIGELAKFGKEIGYKSSQIIDINKQLTILSLLSQLIKELDKNLKNLKKKNFEVTEEAQPLIKKLSEVNLSLGDLRTSVKIE